MKRLTDLDGWWDDRYRLSSTRRRLIMWRSLNTKHITKGRAFWACSLTITSIIYCCRQVVFWCLRENNEFTIAKSQASRPPEISLFSQFSFFPMFWPKRNNPFFYLTNSSTISWYCFPIWAGATRHLIWTQSNTCRACN